MYIRIEIRNRLVAPYAMPVTFSSANSSLKGCGIFERLVYSDNFYFLHVKIT